MDSVMNRTTLLSLLNFVFLIIFALAFLTNIFVKLTIYLIIILPLIILSLGIFILIDSFIKYNHYSNYFDNYKFKNCLSFRFNYKQLNRTVQCFYFVEVT